MRKKGEKDGEEGEYEYLCALIIFFQTIYSGLLFKIMFYN